MDPREMVQEALPDHVVGEELGRGAWGVVFAGTDRTRGTAVAIKQLPPIFGADAAVRARFAQEAQLAASLDHPHVVSVLDHVERDDGLCLLVMERCATTVGDRFRETGIRPDETMAIGLSVCSALVYAHELEVLHRDIKPENLLIGDGLVKLGDFGLARALDSASNLTMSGTLVGTPAYMSPEQAGGETLSAASDQYTLAVVLYEFLTGELPFEDTRSVGALIRHHLLTPPRPLRAVNPNVPIGIAGAVDRALEKDPGRRHTNVRAFGLALAKAAVHAWGPRWLEQAGFPLRASTDLMTAATSGQRGDDRLIASSAPPTPAVPIAPDPEPAVAPPAPASPAPQAPATVPIAAEPSPVVDAVPPEPAVRTDDEPRPSGAISAPRVDPRSFGGPAFVPSTPQTDRRRWILAAVLVVLIVGVAYVVLTGS